MIRCCSFSWSLTVPFICCLLLAVGNATGGTIFKLATLDATRKHQTIDGFGANVNPDQWRNGNIKPTLDLLVDDMGGTLYRFDCFGLADWLDPARRGRSGKFPPEYLREVYTRQDFKDAWATFRYLDSKGVKLFFNVSGKIPRGLAGPDGQTLVDFEGYAEMEGDVELNVTLQGLPAGTLGKPLNYYRTSRQEDCVHLGGIRAEGSRFKAVIKENSIFTLTTLK